MTGFEFVRNCGVVPLRRLPQKHNVLAGGGLKPPRVDCYCRASYVSRSEANDISGFRVCSSYAEMSILNSHASSAEFPLQNLPSQRSKSREGSNPCQIARGLVRSYRQERERVSALRGKLDVPVLLGQPARPFPFPLPCVFDDYTADILENRTLRAATGPLLRLVGIQAETRTSLLQVLARFGEVADEQINLELVDRLLFTRLNKHYEAPIRLAALILRESGVADRAGRVPASAMVRSPRGWSRSCMAASAFGRQVSA